MNASVTSALLTRPAALATRVVANARLDACAAASEQLDAGAPEALHDVRVSLRRLRTWLRTFQPYVDDTVRRRTYRRLKRLVRSTNGARDLEVWKEWLDEQTELATRDRAGARYLAESLTTECAAGHERALERLDRRLPKIIDSLRRELATYSLHIHGSDAVDDRMASAIADALRSGVRRLRRRVNRVESLADGDSIHAARIAAKRLRYLAETLESTEAVDAAQALSELQDLLGAIHDMQLLVDRLFDEIELAAGADARRRAVLKVGMEPASRLGAPPRRAIAGLTEIAARAQHRAENEFLRFMREWKELRIDQIDALVARVADDLEARDQ